jgi:hypothetical protein
MGGPPFPPAFFRAEFSPSSHRRLLDDVTAAFASVALLHLFIQINNHFCRISVKPMAFAVVANDITGKSEDGSNGFVADSFHAEIPYLFFLDTRHCFTSFSQNLCMKKAAKPCVLASVLQP